eukprot:TRINITY_DN1088_c0_g1_i2.p1 TRINITY_DN1088_c0_g1~~TRINITY_DN1088_c0_g1_i2.p1  ORF type:complete len:728 (-),score=169.38 TRINITY_DN1088_c0_g1_i2:51-2234(-)
METKQAPKPQVQHQKEDPIIGLATTDKLEFILKIFILALIYILAFSLRLFSVLRYESVIHEFDPYFNYRTTKVLVTEGLYNFLNWFDDQSWYPLGRIVGGTVYPGLMLTAGLVHNLLNFFNIAVNIRNVCVLLAPWFASNTALAAYFLVKQVKTTGAALFAAAFMGIVPAYISRSVAGSYDNEGVAIFALVFTYALWIKSVNTGSIFWAAMTSLSYFYMVSAWGGYVFIINLIPLYTFAMLVSGRYTHRLYVAYCIFYILGTLLAMQITFVGFAAIQSSEHFASLGMFGLLQIYNFLNWIRSHLSPKSFQNFRIYSIGIIGAVLAIALTAYGMISPWTGRFYSMFDPTYAKIHIPIIASVSEHQPTIWASYFFDLHVLAFVAPAGLYYCFFPLTDASLFLIVYAVTSFYFASVMVRLMLVLAPIVCVLAGIAFSSTLDAHLIPRPIKRLRLESEPAPTKAKPAESARESDESPLDVSVMVSFIVAMMCVFFARHCVWVCSQAYSSPSIVLASQRRDGSMQILDDFRGSYRWLSQNTAPDARILSWWDYGYQIEAMANRTVLVDNNTWNNTHIAQVGRVMSSTEEEAYPLMLALDADYVLVIFGGVIGYSGDDINKFLWMVRISGGVYPDKIQEKNYFADGHYRVDAQASPTMLNCLMYKLSYYRFGEMVLDPSKPAGFDRVRNVEIGNKKIKLKHLEEVYTSENWLVRIYRVKKPSNHKGKIPQVSS